MGVADGLGVSQGQLEVVDRGALEWVLMARTETCLRRAGFEGPEILPEDAPGKGEPRRRERLRRSRLYVPGNQPKLMVSAGLYGADGISPKYTLASGLNDLSVLSTKLWSVKSPL